MDIHYEITICNLFKSAVSFCYNKKKLIRFQLVNVKCLISLVCNVNTAISSFLRLYLSAMHFNENAERDQATTAEGEPIYRLMFPKSKKGKATVKPVKTEATFSKYKMFLLEKQLKRKQIIYIDSVVWVSEYVQDLMSLVFEDIFEDPSPYVAELKTIPVPEHLSAVFERPPKEEVIAAHRSRFSQGGAGPQCTDPRDPAGMAGTLRTAHRDQDTPGESGEQHMTG